MKKIVILLLVFTFAGTVFSADNAFMDRQKKLIEKEEELKKEEARLNALKKETEEKINKYNEILKKIETLHSKIEKIKEGNVSHLTKLYETMNTKNAAQRLSQLDEETAAKIILKMKPKIASEILANMEPAKAASITTLLINPEKKIPTK